MEFIPISFLAGILTVLAPCVLPLLPVIIGGSLAERSWRRPVMVISSLAVSIVLFTLLLKATTLFIGVPTRTWGAISGVIVLLFGIFTLFPHLWEHIEVKFGFSNRSHSWLHRSHQHTGSGGSILVGMAMGPVFSSCSPTYALILATVLPQSFSAGVANLVAYAIGLSLVLLAVALFGQKAIGKMRWAADPKGWFKKGLGILLIVVGIGIMSGVDKKIEAYLIEKNIFDVTKIELKLLK